MLPKSCNWQVRSLRYLPDMRGTGAADVYIVQLSGNRADSVELQVPKGSKYEKIILIECDF
jgi:hypothetical protein